MLEAKFELQLPNGERISYEEAFSPFIVYDARKARDCYLLIPRQEQEKLQGVVIIANGTGIRICYREGWPKGFVSKVKHIVCCKDHKEFQEIDYRKIPSELQYKIGAALTQQIQFKSK